MAEDKDDKTEEPTAKRLEDARKKGDIVYSTEAATWIMLAAGAAMLMMMGAPVSEALGRLLVGFFSEAHTVPADGRSLMAMFAALGLRLGAILGMAALLLIGAGIAARYVQDQPVWSSERLKPSLDKLNPAKNFSRVLGGQAFANFGKALLKFIVVGAAAAWALWPRDAEFETAALLDIAAFWPLLTERAGALFGACLAAFGALALADYVLTRQSYMKKLRMSRHELKEEFRQSEGDPHVRAKLRQVRMERSRRRMLAAVPEATVVITNPTHYAVALKYEQGKTAAPVCLAKGVDDVALRIRTTAEEAGVPVVEDPPLARALYASSDLDQPIAREQYEAVAKVIGYVFRLAERRRRRAPPRPNR